MNLGVSNNMDVYVALAGFQYKSTIRYSLAVTIGSGHEVGSSLSPSSGIDGLSGSSIELPGVAST